MEVHTLTEGDSTSGSSPPDIRASAAVFIFLRQQTGDSILEEVSGSGGKKANIDTGEYPN